MAKDAGYIKIYRSLFDHKLWRERRVFSHAEAWIDILRRAWWDPEKDRSDIIKGKSISYKRGEVPVSLRMLGEDWSWSKNKVSLWFEHLVDDGQIKLRTVDGTDQRVLTVCNYELYNQQSEDNGTADGTPKGQRRDTDGTATGQRRDSDGTTIKKYKNIKKEKNLRSQEVVNAQARPKNGEKTESVNDRGGAAPPPNSPFAAPPSFLPHDGQITFPKQDGEGSLATLELWNGGGAKFMASIPTGGMPSEGTSGDAGLVFRQKGSSIELPPTIAALLTSLVRKWLTSTSRLLNTDRHISTILQEGVKGQSLERIITDYPDMISGELTYSILLRISQQVIWVGSVQIVAQGTRRTRSLTLTASYQESVGVNTLQAICESFAPTATNAGRTTSQTGEPKHVPPPRPPLPLMVWGFCECDFSDDTRDLWVTLCGQKKWKRKEFPALTTAMLGLMRYQEAFAKQLLASAITGEYQGVIFADTDEKYQRWQRTVGNEGSGNRATDSYTDSDHPNDENFYGKL